MNPRHAALVAVLLAGMAGCRSSGAVPQAPPPEPREVELTLGAHDVLRVGVYGHPELSALPYANTASGTRVDRDGNLSLPLVGPVAVGGRTMTEAREAITAAFARYIREPKIDVSVVEYAARRFYLYGEVREPGAYVLDRPLSLYQGLALGKGFTPHAKRGQIILLRGDAERFEVHVFDGERMSPEGMIALLPDDLVFVRRSRAGKFSEEILPILQGISSSLTSVATLFLIDDQLND
ncbi:MAG TPA: polysaccharide biosynthesis/export family protein [Candidatus Limnocylindrales bacterium]|nr:polysaccharide biosynthesis/export family protein [Candidatus Limnocylindrales bacterium]